MLNTAQRSFPKITENALDELRQRIGVPIGDTVEPWCYEATRDNIRHYAHGIGDDNPLWCEPDYAAKTRYGDVIAPPSFVFALNRILSGYVGGLPGIHAMWAGADLTWHEGRSCATVRDPHRGLLKDSGRAPDALRRPGLPADLPRRDLRLGRAALLCSGDVVVLPHRARHGARTRHQVRRRQGPPADAATHAEELDGASSSPYAAETDPGRRAALHRGRRVGEALPTMAQGPDDRHRVHRLRPGLGRPLHPGQQARLQAAAKHPGLGIANRFGMPDCPSGCTGRTSSPPTSARPAPTTTAPSGARGSPITSPTGWATTASCAAPPQDPPPQPGRRHPVHQRPR